MIKPASLLWLLVTCIALTAGTEPPPPAASRPIQGAATDAEEAEFQDPFATQEGPPKLSISDPLQRVNRAFFKFNDKLYFWVLKPVAKAYGKVAPEPFRQSVHRLFLNIRYPVRLVNNLLQGKFKRAGMETARFIVNSTVGIGGLFDPAQDEWRLQPYPEDFDQTLGFYHIPPGIYLNWPFLGPSSVRGTVGMVGDNFLNPVNYTEDLAIIYGTRIGDTVNTTSLRLGEYENFKNAAFDPYLALRDAYFENRLSLVRD